MLQSWGTINWVSRDALDEIRNIGRGAHWKGETKNPDSDMTHLRRLLNSWAYDFGVQKRGLGWKYKCESSGQILKGHENK